MVSDWCQALSSPAEILIEIVLVFRDDIERRRKDKARLDILENLDGKKRAHP